MAEDLLLRDHLLLTISLWTSENAEQISGPPSQAEVRNSATPRLAACASASSSHTWARWPKEKVYKFRNRNNNLQITQVINTIGC